MTKKTKTETKKKIRATFDCDRELWTKIDVLAHETGFKKGALVESILRSAVEYRGKTIEDLVESMFKDFLNGSSKGSDLKEQLKLL